MSFNIRVVVDPELRKLADGRGFQLAIDEGLRNGILRGGHLVADAMGEAIKMQPYAGKVAEKLRGEFTRDELASRIGVIPTGAGFQVLVGVSDPLVAHILTLWTKGGKIKVTDPMRRYLAHHGFHTAKKVLVVPATGMIQAARDASVGGVHQAFVRALAESFRRRLA